MSNFSQGQIFINGVPLEENRDWYVSNTGYVIQLARPYYEELTVRENLTFAAWIRLKNTAREKFQRVEQVMDVVRGGGMREKGFTCLCACVYTCVFVGMCVCSCAQFCLWEKHKQ